MFFHNTCIFRTYIKSIKSPSYSPPALRQICFLKGHRQTTGALRALEGGCTSRWGGLAICPLRSPWATPRVQQHPVRGLHARNPSSRGEQACRVTCVRSENTCPESLLLSGPPELILTGQRPPDQGMELPSRFPATPEWCPQAQELDPPCPLKAA